jgi:hypothetical protein
MAFLFDQTFKLSSDEDAFGSVKYVAGVRLSKAAVVESLDRELNLERLHADHHYLVEDRGRKCIHHFEALAWYRTGWEQPQIDHAIYAGLKFRLPVVSHLLLMNARGTPRSIDNRIVRVYGRLRHSLRVNVVRLWQRPAAEVLAAGRIALYPWIALMDASVEQQREAARRIQSSGREALQMQMALMGTLRYGSREAFYERIGRMLLTKEILRQSPLWQEIEREGQRVGEAIGEARGEARGEEKGARSTVRLLLEVRFGSLPDWAEEKLGSASLDFLKHWLKRATSATSLEDVFE